MRSAKEAAEFFKDKETNMAGRCLWHVQDAFQSPHMYVNAITQWYQAKHKHFGDRTPPVGAPVYFKGGRHGHVAIYVGGGKVRSTDAGGSGKMATVSIDWFLRNWGYTYLGWTEDIGGENIDFDDRVDVHVKKLRAGVDDSTSVRMLRLALIRRGFLTVRAPLSKDNPGNKYTPAVERAVKLWQKKKKHNRTGILTNAQAKEFFAPNKRVKVIPK